MSRGAVTRITVERPLGLSTMGLRPAALIRVMPGRADQSRFHRMLELVSVDFLPT
ncbi:hypothetical protein BH23CHL7_BH23CHL7_12920 [soil metagenome]